MAALRISDKQIEHRIYVIRDEKVMLDSDLAELYGVETRVLNQAVSRNKDRFPEDFMFRLTKEEWEDLKSQNATSRSWGGRRKPPNAFTEHGVLMLSSVLNSERAIQVNIRIMRIYTRFREMALTHKELLLKLEKIEKKITEHDEDLQLIFEHLKELLNPPTPPRKQIGFKREEDDEEENEE